MRPQRNDYELLQPRDSSQCNGIESADSWRSGVLSGTTNGNRFPSLRQPLSNKILVALAFLQFIAITVSLACIWRFPSINKPTSPFLQLLYSPVQDLIHYQVEEFNDGYPGPNLPIYAQPSSEQVDQAWHNLTQYAYSRIPKELASHLPNRTLPIPNDPDGYYMVGIDVFHQLHCLDLLRQALDRDYYPWPYDYVGWVAGVGHIDWGQHLSHCVDSIRQSLMCTADMSISEMHTCRNFDDIWVWARDHHAKQEFNMTIHIQDDLKFPVLYQ